MWPGHTPQRGTNLKRLTKGQRKLVLYGLAFASAWLASTGVAMIFAEPQTQPVIVRINEGVQLTLFAAFMFAAGFLFGAVAYSDKPEVRRWFAQNLKRKGREWLDAE